jgi:quercetin dioxygenase-like cupin family protein
MKRKYQQIKIHRKYFEEIGDAETVREKLIEEGLFGYVWSNRPGDTYPAHSHNYDKVIVILEGSIKFGFPQGEEEAHLSEGDRLELPAGILHDAIVGPRGVVCYEAHH